MDPNATWQRILQLQEEDNPENAEELLAAMQDLDEWLANGGFAPEGWPF